MDTKHGTRYAYIDFEDSLSIGSTVERLRTAILFDMHEPLQVRARYDRHATPYITNDASHGDDYKTIHILNCPHNINKVFIFLNKIELEQLLEQMGEIKRIKIFQRALEKKASAFISFRTADFAKRARLHLIQQGSAVFRESDEVAVVEYPTTEESKHKHATILTDAQCETELVGTLSKKARKLAASENRIVYIRQVEMPVDELKDALRVHGPLRAFHLLPPRAPPAGVKISETKSDATDSQLDSAQEKGNRSKDTEAVADAPTGDQVSLRSEESHIQSSGSNVTIVNDISQSSEQEILKPTAFAVFETPSSAAQAIANKTGGCTLPRHKRVDLPLQSSATTSEIRTYLQSTAEIKQIILDEKFFMVEFVTAVGAAKGIVHCRSTPFKGSVIPADYSPSIQPQDDGNLPPATSSEGQRDSAIAQLQGTGQ